MRYRLRTLLILLAVLPPTIAVVYLYAVNSGRVWGIALDSGNRTMTVITFENGRLVREIWPNP